LEGKSIVVQGLGNVGYHAAKFLSEEDGARIVAIIERDGVVHNENGLDVDEVYTHIQEMGSIKGFGAAKFDENGAAGLEIPCDILIPAALKGQITDSNAERVQAKLVVEAANGPVTYEANEILRNRGVVILPDVYVNAGGVTVSYFEWIRNISHIRFGRMQRRHEEMRGHQVATMLEEMTGTPVTEKMKNDIAKGASEIDLVRSGLDDTMRLAYQEMRERWHGDPQVDDLRTAAFVIAIEKISRTYLDLGVY